MKHNKTFRLNNKLPVRKNRFTEKYKGRSHLEEDESFIRNPALEKHRQMFLGKPGSNEWTHFYAGLRQTKQRLFDNTNESSSQLVGGTKKECKTSAWLKELFETNDMKELLEFAQKQIEDDKESIKVPPEWQLPENNVEPLITKIIGVKSDNVVSTDKNTVTPCSAEDIKIQFIPFFLQIYMKLIEKIKEQNKKEAANDLFGKKKQKTTPATNDNSADIAIAVASNNSIPSSIQSSIPSSIVSTDNNNNNNTNEIATATAIAQFGGNVSSLMTKMRGGDGNTEYTSAKLRNLLLFCITVLRTLNLYANPLFFDDLYYYYYFLSLDKILPNLDDIFRSDQSPPQEPLPKNNSKVNMKMRVYQQFPDDDPKIEASANKHYGYEMEETITGANPSTNFDMFLNLVQLHPDFYYKIPVKSEISRDFNFQEIPVKKEDADKKNVQKIVKVDVTKPESKQEGGGFFDNLYSMASSSLSLSIPNIEGDGTYKYLDDNILPREFEDILKDENDVYDGNVFLCIYSLDKSCNFDGKGPTPFLKFITKKNGDKWSFPSFHYKSVSDPEQNKSRFKCEMFDAVMDCFEIHLCSIGQELAETPIPLVGDVLSKGGDNLQNTSESGTPIQTDNAVVGPGQEEPQVQTDNVVAELSQEEPPMQTENAANGPETPMQTEDTVVESGTEAPPMQTEESGTQMQTGDVANKPETPMQTENTAIEGEEQSLNQTQPVSKETCINLASSLVESSLEAVYNGLVLEEIDGVRQLFVFLNYDALDKIIQQNAGTNVAEQIFCKNDNSQIYPIHDANDKSALKWATVDELVVEKKIVNDDVDPVLSTMFLKNQNRWNIEDQNSNYILFPFVVYGLEKTADNKFATVQYDGDETEFTFNGKIEQYGTPKEGEDGISDEYSERYCFSLHPRTADENPVANENQPANENTENPPANENAVANDNTENPPANDNMENPPTNENAENPPETVGGSSSKPRRYVMFAWNTRYILPDSEPKKDDLDKVKDNAEDEETEDNDAIAMAKLTFPTIYTITKNSFTNNEPMVTWGILNSQQFIGL